MFMTKYESPVGNLTLVSNGRQLTGLFVDGQRYFPDVSKMETKKDLAVFDATIHWLDAYFEGKSPCGETIPLKFKVSGLEIEERFRIEAYGDTKKENRGIINIY